MPTRRHTAPILALLALASGCSDPLGVGHYRVDVQEMRTQLLRLMARLPDDQSQMLKPKLDAMLASLESTEFVLHPDQTFEAHTQTPTGDPSQIEGIWQIEGEKISLLQTHEDGLPDSDERIGFFYGRSIRFIEGEGRDRIEVVLRKTPATP